ncbi:MAG: hypothetical protein MJ135_03375 [Oscillospiraceae bacterium]|nr:hypothetical protein [Oscillospiraceae bacterium]
MKLKKILPLLCAVLFLSIPLLSVPAHAAGCPVCGGSMTTGGYPASCEEEGFTYGTCNSCGYSYERPVPATGHSYKTSTSASCTKGGVTNYICTRCGKGYEENSGPLGHNYKKTVTDPTCTEDGEELIACSRCGQQQKKLLPALGHDYETEEVLPTCTAEGSRSSTCKTCGDTSAEILPALGHSYKAEETPATCTADGLRTATCSECGDVAEEALPAPGHRFGDWALVTAPTLFREGLEERHCSECSASETNTLPKKSPSQSPGAIAIISAAAVSLVAGIAFAVKKAAAASAAAAAASASLPYITLVMKSLLLCLQENETNKAFIEELARRPYLDLKTVPYGDEAALAEMAADEKPDLILFSADASAQLSRLTEAVTAAYKDADFAVIDEAGTIGAELAAMKEAGQIMSFASAADSSEKKIVNLILPLYKPDRNSSNWAENATLITDALGLPIISILLNTYVVGGDIVEVVKNRGMGMMDAADIVNDAAALLGLDTLSNIAEVLRIGSDQHARLADNKQLNAKRSAQEPAAESGD